MNRALSIAIATLLVSLATAAPARDKDEIPPANALRLSEIVQSLEAQGHTVITDIDFDDWQWIVRVYKAGFEFEIRVDPVTGKTLSIDPKT
jgi:hypothetical protein